MSNKTSFRKIYQDSDRRSELGLKSTNTYFAAVGSLYIEDGFNVRNELDHDHIREISKSYASGNYVPAIVVEHKAEGLKVIDGHHRYEAAVLAGLESVEVKNFTGDECAAVAFMVTSSQGRNLTPMERANAYLRMKEAGMTVKDISERLARSQKDVKNHLTLLEASPQIQEAVQSGQLGYAAAVEELNRNPEGGQERIEKQLNEAEGKKVTRASLATFTKKDYVRAMDLLAEMEIYDESLPSELVDLISKYKESK